ncbi:MAG: hypothetical protein PQJ59_13475 [Spirochaetales bacterium]|nr:hypothetical protein [Spirochaetales bacterium]
MKKVLTLFTLAALFASCSSLADNAVPSVNNEAFRETEILYSNIVRFYLALPMEKEEDQLDKELTGLLDVESYNKDYRVRVLGLNALWNQLQGKKARAGSLLNEAKETGRQEELIYITEALLSKETLTELQKGEEELYMTRYLPLFLGEASFGEGDFGQCISYYEKLPGDVPLDIQQYAHKRSENAMTLYKSGSTDGSEADILTKEQILLGDFLSLFYEKSPLLPDLKGDSTDGTLNNWQEVNILTQDEEEETLLLRRNTALLLYRMAHYLEEGVSIGPDESWSGMSGDSPISDVPYSDPDFPAILLVIEREWINLVNGEDFNPHWEMEGKELLPLLEKLNDYYSLQAN